MLVFSFMVVREERCSDKPPGVSKLYLFTRGNMQNREKNVACCRVPVLCIRGLPFYNSKFFFCKI